MFVVVVVVGVHIPVHLLLPPNQVTHLALYNQLAQNHIQDESLAYYRRLVRIQNFTQG